MDVRKLCEQLLDEKAIEQPFQGKWEYKGGRWGSDATFDPQGQAPPPGSR